MLSEKARVELSRIVPRILDEKQLLLQDVAQDTLLLSYSSPSFLEESIGEISHRAHFRNPDFFFLGGGILDLFLYPLKARTYALLCFSPLESMELILWALAGSFLGLPRSQFRNYTH